MITIQLFGVVVALGAIHLTYLYYKRANFTKRELFFWLFIWLSFIFVAVFPRSVTPVIGYLGLRRPMDLIMLIAFVVLFALTFHNYVINRKQEKRLRKLVQSLALKDLEDFDK